MAKLTEKNVQCKNDGFVAIVSVGGGIVFIMVLMIALFAPSQLEAAIPLSWSIVLLSVVVAYFQYKAIKARSE